MNEIVIRDFQTDDLSPLVHVLKRNIPTYFDPSEEAEFVTYIGKHSDTYFTALVNQQVAGGQQMPGLAAVEADAGNQALQPFLAQCQHGLRGVGHGKQPGGGLVDADIGGLC